jgi:murein DD-endopeptidase MepM/ murein hydrolase activator NlpD
MKEKKTIIEKISSGKGFYITVALSLGIIVAAIAFIYNSSVNMLEGLDIPTTFRQVEKNQTNIKDPRETHESTETTRQKSTSQTQPASSSPATTATTQPPSSTDNVEVFNNDSFILPSTGDIDKPFSLNPVYDETMEDWRIHKGTDFIAQAGEEVKSIGNGKVSKVIFDPTWGYCIEVNYGEITARYCGIEQGSAVGIDDIVSKGDTIGKVAAIPCESKQDSHLHFETVKDGKWLDPISVINDKNTN